MIDMNKLPKQYNGRDITFRIPHSLRAEPIVVEAGSKGNHLRDKHLVWNVDKPLEVYSLATRMYGLDKQGRVLDQQPRVLPFFVTLTTMAAALNESFGDLRPVYDEGTPNTVIYRLPMPFTMQRGDSFDIAINSTVKEFDVVMNGGGRESDTRVLSIAAIRIEAYFEGAVIVLAPPSHSVPAGVY